MKVEISITQEHDHGGNMLETYVVSDTGGDWDDEGELSLTDAESVADERAEHYQTEGHTCKITRD